MSAPALGPPQQPVTPGAGLRARIIAFLSAVLAAPLLLILADAWSDYAREQQRVEVNTTRLANRAAATLERIVNAQIGHLDLFAQLQAVREGDPRQCSEAARRFVELNPRYANATFSGRDGRLACAATALPSPAPDISDRDWYRDVMSGRSALVLQAIIGRLVNVPLISAAAPVIESGDLIGVAVVSLRISWLRETLLLELSDDGDWSMILLYPDGRVLTHSRDEGGDYQGRLHPQAATLLAQARGPEAVEIPDIDGQPHRYAVREMTIAAGSPLLIAIGFPAHATRRMAVSGILELLIPFLAIAGLSFFGAILLGERLIRQPVRRIMETIGRYAAGDRSARNGPPYSAGEIGRLAAALDGLADAIESRDRDLKDARATLTTMSSRLVALIEASPIPIIVVSKDYLVQLWNPAAEGLFGYTAAEAIGHRALFVPKAEEAESRALIARVFAGETINGVSLQRQHKDGHLLDVRLALAPLRDGEGRIDGAVVLMQDETARNIAERKFAEAQKMEAVGALTGGLSHDFNNLLGVIVGNLDLAAEKAKGRPDIQGYLEAALNAALRGADLNRSLLAFARRQTLAPQIVQVDQEIESIVRLLSQTLGETIQVRAKTAPGIWPVCVDVAQLQSAIVNLGINARDAMPGGGTLVIDATNREVDAAMTPTQIDLPPGEYVVISVSDTGAGMTEDVRARIFEPFFTTKAVGKGTGLGLSMVHGFVKQSGGHITVYSEPGRGTTFRLYLPRAVAANPPATAPETGPGGFAAPQAVVLLVDDSPDLRELVERQLIDLGYQVVSAERADAALAILESGRRIDLLLTDVVMPGGADGRQLAAEAARRRPGLKVLLMSGYADPRASQPYSEGAASWRYLEKPFRQIDLAQALREVLAG